MKSYITIPCKEDGIPQLLSILGDQSEAVPGPNKQELFALESSQCVLVNSPNTNASWFGKVLKGNETESELRAMRKALELEWNLDPRKIAIYTINTFQ